MTGSQDIQNRWILHGQPAYFNIYMCVCVCVCVCVRVRARARMNVRAHLLVQIINNRLNIFALLGTWCVYPEGSTQSLNPSDQSMKSHCCGNLKILFLEILTLEDEGAVLL